MSTRSIILLILGFGGGYLVSNYLISTIHTDQNQTFQDTSAIVMPTPDKTLTKQESDSPQTTQETKKETEDNTQIINNSLAEEIRYCQDLKSKVSNSEPYVIMTELASGAQLQSSQLVSGCVYAPNGSYAGWAPFEGQIGSYELVAPDGTSLASGPLQVVSDNWISQAHEGQPLKYQAEIMFQRQGHTSATLLFRNENASGEPDQDRTITIPLQL